MTLHLASWNVNGIRAAIKKDKDDKKKGLMHYMNQTQPDVLCLQEVRALPEQIKADFEGYHVYWNPAEKKGYSGTGILSKQKPLDVKLGINIAEHDTEGRVITAEYEEYFLVTVYTPNAGNELVRLPYRQEWDKAFLKYVKKLEKKKPVIFCGDLNVAHKEIDLANPKTNVNNAGFTPEERAGFDQIVASGFIDTFREFNQEGGNYSWWSFRSRAREKNVGWRIDYFCISPDLRPILKEARIHADVYGSDHCPVSILIK